MEHENDLYQFDVFHLFSDEDEDEPKVPQLPFGKVAPDTEKPFQPSTHVQFQMEQTGL